MIINWAISTLFHTYWLVSLLLLLSLQFILQTTTDPKLDYNILPDLSNFKSFHCSYDKNISFSKARNTCGTGIAHLFPHSRFHPLPSDSHSLLHLYLNYFSSLNVPGSFPPWHKMLSLPWTLCLQLMDPSKNQPKCHNLREAILTTSVSAAPHPHSSWVYILTLDLPTVQNTVLMSVLISDGQSSWRDSTCSQDKGTCWACSLLHAFQCLID